MKTHPARTVVPAAALLLGAILILAAPVFSAPQKYIVQPGDTLWAIAQRHGVSVEALASENGLTNPDAIRIGQRLRVPTSVSRRAPAPAAGSRAAGASPRPTRIVAGPLPSRGAKWGSALLSAASRHVGVRYRWGGMSPRGFDCSGFIAYVMRAVGVAVPRTTWAIWASGRPVARDDLRVGDIVFFTTTRPGPSHAGIYIGNNQFIHASSGFGRVTVTSMDYRYYKPRYLGARRF